MSAAESQDASERRIAYLFDPYDPWSFAFSQTAVELWRRHGAEVPFEALCGGVYVGARARSATSLGLHELIGEVSAATRVGFGIAFNEAIRGGFIVDSVDAARGFAALRSQDPGHAIELAAAQQGAFFIEGRSLSDLATYRAIAEAEGLDPDRVEAAFTDRDSVPAAHKEFHDAKRLGFGALPAAVLLVGERRFPFVAGRASLGEAESRLNSALRDSQR